MKPLAYALVTALAGCGSSPVWTHPTKEMSQYKRDFADCERFFGASEREVDNCMIRRGWRRERR
ncbi:MAG: hypothetical protein ACT4P4_29135 [Betaproteobacteria bacterium]